MSSNPAPSRSGSGTKGLGVILTIGGVLLTIVGAVGGGSSFDGNHEILSEVSGAVWVLAALLGLGIMFVGVSLAERK